MRILVFFVATALLSLAAFAGDLEDAKKAFATMVEYQKTDDERSPDLFSKSCAVTVVFVDSPDKKTLAIPMEAFVAELKAQLALKKGATETYEDVTFQQEGAGIRLTAKLHYVPANRTAPFSALFRRDDDGVMRIREFQIPAYGK